MPDYYPLLSSVVEALAGTSAEVRRRLYDSARTGFLEQMRKREPPLADSYINQQQIAMEEAIRRVEKEQMSRPARREEVPDPAKSGIAVSRAAPIEEVHPPSDAGGVAAEQISRAAGHEVPDSANTGTSVLPSDSTEDIHASNYREMGSTESRAASDWIKPGPRTAAPTAVPPDNTQNH